MTPAQSEIAEAVNRLDRERRAAMQTLMHEFDVEHYRKLAELRAQCGQAGHHWHFEHLGPLGSPWFRCGVCRAAECRPD